MSSHMPPVPPANRSKKGERSERKVSIDEKLVKHEHHANSAEEGGHCKDQAEHDEQGFFPWSSSRLIERSRQGGAVRTQCAV
jgi:hypothetical protein